MLFPTNNKAVHFFLTSLLCCCLLINTLPCFAQITFNKTYDFEDGHEFGGCIVKSFDGNYIIAAGGWTNRFSDWMATQLFKIDTLGNLIWSTAYGDSGYWYIGSNSGALIQTSDSNYVLCGQQVNLGEENGGDVLLMKFDENGDTLWMKTYGLSGKTEYSRQVVQTKDHGFAIIGYTNGYGAGSGDYYLIKTDSMGNRQWHKTYGSIGDDGGSSIAITQDGGYILGGGAESYGKGFTDGYVIKLDSLWKTQWTKTYGTEKDDCGVRVSPTIDDGYIMRSCLDTVINIGDYFSVGYIAKLDNNGNVIWRTFFNTKESQDLIIAKEINDENYLALFGFIDDDSTGNPFGALAKLDKDGNVLWERKYYTRMDDSQYFRDVLETKDGGFVITGTASPIDTWGKQDMWLIKLDSMGCLVAGCDTINGIMDLTPNVDAGVLVYPNPAKDKAYITYQLNAHFNNAEIKLFDILGKEISSFTVTQKAGEITLNTAHLYEGLYVVKLISQNKVLGIRKMVITK